MTYTGDEIDFTKHALVALSRIPDVRVWRQNTGSVPVRDSTGRVLRYFDAGPPVGAADISGIARGGRRIEIELKMPTGVRSDAQSNWARLIQQFGGIYLLFVYDQNSTLEENLRQLQRILTETISA